jgi:hypothetical protein
LDRGGPGFLLRGPQAVGLVAYTFSSKPTSETSLPRRFRCIELVGGSLPRFFEVCASQDRRVTSTYLVDVDVLGSPENSFSTVVSRSVVVLDP